MQSPSVRKGVVVLLKNWCRAIALFSWMMLFASTGVPAAMSDACGEKIDIDRVWAGVRVSFAAVQHDDTIFVGYYDSERYLTVAQIDIRSRSVTRTRLPVRFAGWDGHNSVALAFDAAGTMHVAANMHASPLTYFQGQRPFGQSDFQPMAMIGRDESHVTYPTFIKDSQGSLLFFYRSGGSGDGTMILDRWDGAGWSRVVDKPIFASRFEGKSVSAYPSRLITSPDGVFHVAVVWRRTPDVSTNFRISYARTRDFRVWTDARGRVIPLPMSPETAQTVIDTGERAGLLNNAPLSVDPEGRPVVTFTRYASSGNNQIEVARWDGAAWHVQTIATGQERLTLEGTGSIPRSVPLTNVDFSNSSSPSVVFRLPGQSRMRQPLDKRTLAPQGPPTPADMDVPAACFEKPVGLVAPSFNARLVERSDNRQSVRSFIIWTAQSTNRDQPRACTADAPQACSPPSQPLQLLLHGSP
jgi:hypothetical protein